MPEEKAQLVEKKTELDRRIVQRKLILVGAISQNIETAVTDDMRQQIQQMIAESEDLARQIGNLQ